jgi:hypothetical protein
MELKDIRSTASLDSLPPYQIFSEEETIEKKNKFNKSMWMSYIYAAIVFPLNMYVFVTGIIFIFKGDCSNNLFHVALAILSSGLHFINCLLLSIQIIATLYFRTEILNFENGESLRYKWHISGINAMIISTGLIHFITTLFCVVVGVTSINPFVPCDQFLNTYFVWCAMQGSPIVLGLILCCLSKMIKCC